jgi:hypothetical protein
MTISHRIFKFFVFSEVKTGVGITTTVILLKCLSLELNPVNNQSLHY